MYEAQHLGPQRTRERASADLGQRVSCLVVIGTRPEAIKLFPVIRALQQSPLSRPFVVFTGQHPDLVLPVLDMAGVTIDADLEAAQPGQSLNGLVASIVSAFDGLLTDLRGGPERRTRPRMFSAPSRSGHPYPAATLVHGDTTSALAAGLASSFAMLPVVHVESGLRTGNRLSPFPEEMNRQTLARLASLHLAPTASNMANLVREGIDPRLIFVTGNTGLDALQFAARQRVPWPDDRLDALDDPARPVIVATAHRRENWGNGIRGIAEGLARIARARPDVVVVLPMHPNPRVRADLTPALAALPNVLLTEPLDYTPFARLLSRATLAITDSGGIQEEAPSVGTPVLVTRASSERAEGIDAGTLKLVGTDPEVIADTALELLSDPVAYATMQHAVNPFGDGRAAERIARALEHLVFGTPPPAAYGQGFSRHHILSAAGYRQSEIDGLPHQAVEQMLAEVQQGNGHGSLIGDLPVAWTADR